MEVKLENIQLRIKELLESVDLIVTSPLTRTCQTTVGGLGFLIERGVKVVVDARIQGIYIHSLLQQIRLKTTISLLLQY
jgi:phosphohistidine phosphatase SixA